MTMKKPPAWKINIIPISIIYWKCKNKKFRIKSDLKEFLYLLFMYYSFVKIIISKL